MGNNCGYHMLVPSFLLVYISSDVLFYSLLSVKYNPLIMTHLETLCFLFLCLCSFNRNALDKMIALGKCLFIKIKKTKSVSIVFVEDSYKL